MTTAVTRERVARWLQRAIVVALVAAVAGWLLVVAPKPDRDKSPLAIELPQAADLATAGSEFSAAVQRPLFWPDRKPGASAPPADGAAAAGEDQAPPAAGGGLEFVAAILEGDQRFAIVRSQASGVHRLKEGDSVDGWQVSSISPRTISLRSASGELELTPPAKPTVTLSEAQKPPPTPAAAAEASGAEVTRQRGRDRRGANGKAERGANGKAERGDQEAAGATQWSGDPPQLPEGLKALADRLKNTQQ